MSLGKRIQGKKRRPLSLMWGVTCLLVTLTHAGSVHVNNKKWVMTPITSSRMRTTRQPRLLFVKRTDIYQSRIFSMRGGGGGTEESAAEESSAAANIEMTSLEATETKDTSSESSREDHAGDNASVQDDISLSEEKSPIEDSKSSTVENIEQGEKQSEVDDSSVLSDDQNKEDDNMSLDNSFAQDVSLEAESAAAETPANDVHDPSSVEDSSDEDPLIGSSIPAVFETTTTTVLEDSVAVEETIEKEPEPEAIDPATLTEEQVDEIVEEASLLRAAGKEAHDMIDFEAAAVKFGAAADMLQAIVSYWTDWTDEFATCRLHEALCRLKTGDYEGAVDACTDVLELQEESDVSVAPALRARAYHRRAKARLELSEETDALEDARAAAFLGDRKAVALYGKLMRGSSSMSLLDDNDSSNDLAASSALFESLLSKASGMDMMNDASPAADAMTPPPFPMPNLFGMGQMLGAGDGSKSGGNMAKSVLTSLSKRLEDEATQDQICSYLQQTSAPQLQQMAGMAGFPLKDSHASTLINFCHKVTPKTIGRTVRNTKRALYGFQLIRKTYKVLVKYRTLLIVLALLAWTKSALLRPLPINKAAVRRAVKEAAKAAALAAANNAAGLV